MKARPISISLSPNTQRDDVFLALKLIFQFWKWKKGKETLKLEEEFKKYIGAKYAFSFNSGRSSLFAILKSLDIKEGEEVLLQGFTCNAAVNPVIWAKLKPVFVDCNKDDYNIDVLDLQKKVSSKSKVVIIQHTFGQPADIDGVLKVCNENNLILIEDCAHSLGAKYKGKLVGSFGKASFFSFSRDKVISSVYGGMAVSNDERIGDNLKKIKEELKDSSSYFVFQQLLHPILLNWLVLPIYRFFNLGKIFLVFFQILHILSKAVHYKEKRGKIPSYFPARMPNALSILALNQFKKLQYFNSHRKKMADFYYQNLKDSSFILPSVFEERENIFLRFTIRHKDAWDIIYNAWDRENILIGDWYTSPIAPHDTISEKMGYLGDCKNAKALSKETFNLPTHINLSFEDAKRIVSFLKKWK
ncbi:MAG: DegT/DnrJ/EryC1/StrS family aminotransferase [Candidatus Pacebacteria bacterium]|nr:DegT/DnrJ/EryC1/StrS family aminotransferase [Candidatus Paceibacterota bacterium]MDD5446252.1 DegT/DnrJ/EryC1/StrS family aminotransferase [Candidatus Paceibacterota bacterium]